jgi:Domain of Unknown Function (DUF1080)
MNNKIKVTILCSLILAFGTIPFGHARDDQGQAKAGASSDSTRPADAYKGCVRIFDGKTFEGWEADPSTWSIVDGAMRGVGGSSRLAYTKADHGSFRLIFTARMNPVNGDHLGVLFWGDRPKDPAKPGRA